ncbi:MAG: regulatory protein RecX [Chlamydiales bacterium]|nr:regulatory protein RecX [Chlamydiales bacterium]
MAEGAFRYVLSLLAKKGYFSRELREKLSKRGYSLKAIEKTIELCTARGYLNDEAESERAIASEVRKGRGPLYIAAKLKARSRIVSPAIKNIDQRASILLLLPKLCKKYDPKTYEGRGKLFQALQRRGFETEAILSCIEQQFPV